MAIRKVVGGSQKASGPMFGQTVPMMKPKMATAQGGMGGMKPQGELVGHVGSVRGQGKPAEKTMRNTPFKRPQQHPGPTNTFGYAHHDYQPKKRI